MIQLIDPILGTLELRADPFVVVSLQIGPRAARVNARTRALADGTVDDTKYVGGRAATLTLRLNDRAGCADPVSMQALYDLLLPFTVPRRRPIMRWSLPGSPGVERQMTVRGDPGAAVVVAQAKHPAVVCSFVSDGEITSPEQECVLIDPALDVEAGRPYDLTFPRDYPASVAVGDRVVAQNGNERAHWFGTIYGPVTNPYVTVNGVQVRWDQNTGVTLIAGEYLTIDTRERTVYLNGDPAFPRYDRTNFTEWTWDDLMLEPGDNSVRFGDTALAGGQLQLCWSATWAG